MLTVHHLGKSQSERIVRLCEELGLSYDLKVYERDPVTRLAPPQYKALHPLGAAPVIEDGDVVLAESGAIIDYIAAKYGNGRLMLGPDHPDFVNLPDDNAMLRAMKGRLGLVEARLAKADYLAGRDFTTADIMIVFTLTTMRLFQPYELGAYLAILAYLQRIGRRDAYCRAMEKGDPGMVPLLT